VEKRVATVAPALCLLQRRKLLRLAEQASGAALLGAPSLVVGHDLKLSADAAPQARPRVVRIATFNPAEMQATQVPSNQDSGGSGNIVTEVTKVLASADRSRMSYVAKRLKRLRASDAQPRAIKRQRQRDRRPGWITEVVVRALIEGGKPMRATHVHAAVERLLGHSVSKDSVDSCLSKGASGKEPRFERVSLGCYRLALS
jgi:hypothetical protein